MECIMYVCVFASRRIYKREMVCVCVCLYSFCVLFERPTQQRKLFSSILYPSYCECLSACLSLC